ncbi:S53 family peptidase [Streptacidiphilus fuscans]|uniref:S53 family peptidase n=1 Tax=Streptacidiphilus fuscans TaxID=2789292 RepID=A0A931B131_9ACTN|nr:S53 family peptidase [Streptacidiphilus fuscans]MBF9069149.1 S53 family peptidase [Streptacidiphilus fuscans]
MRLISRSRLRLGAAAVGVAALTATASTVALSTTAYAGPAASAHTASSTAASTVRDVCGAAKAGYDRCLAEVRTDVHEGLGVRGKAAAAVTGHAAALPAGFGPADLQAAYKLPSTGGANQTVAIVDAGDDASAEADLAVYRATYGLPACTTADGCFTKVNQTGASAPLPADQGWGIEIALDVDMVSAACPQCHILLVESDDASSQNLAASVDTAVRLGATEVSNSYGATEGNGIQAYAPDYAHPGVAIFASSGDSGYGIPIVPAAYSSVIAVGGTSLTKDVSARGWSETAWGGAGSGCSAWIDKPAWQRDQDCPGRMTADVSADADPNTGPAVYDANPHDGTPGWGVVGGTSAASPFLAGVVAQAGNPAKFPNASAFYSPSAAAGLNDVVGGANGSCAGDYLCTAVAGYDGPTGMGSPNGLSAF